MDVVFLPGLYFPPNSLDYFLFLLSPLPSSILGNLPSSSPLFKEVNFLPQTLLFLSALHFLLATQLPKRPDLISVTRRFLINYFDILLLFLK